MIDKKHRLRVDFLLFNCLGGRLKADCEAVFLL